MTVEREALEQAATQLESPPEPAEAAPATPAPEPAAAAESTPAEPTAAATARARDEQGRFAKGAPAPAAKAGETAPAQAPEPAAPPAPPEPPKETFRAPQSWKPTAREAFNRLPPDLQAALGPEFVRREQEIARTMQETADARKFHERFTEMVRPYEQFIRAAGHEPLQTVQGLMQTLAALNSGNPAQVLAVAQSVINEYGVKRFGPKFIEQLDAALAGGPRQPVVDPGQIAQQVRQSLIAEAQQRREQQMATQASSAVAKARESLEFFDDIGEMKIRNFAAALLEDDGSLTVDAALKEAHDVLASRNRELSAVLAQRKAAQAAANANASTQRTAAAASSVRSSPAAAIAAHPKGERAALHAAAEKLGL